MITFSQHVPKKDKIGLSLYNRTFACTEVIVVKEVIAIAFLVVYLAIKHMALTSLTPLNPLTSPFAKVEFIILLTAEP